MRLVDMLALEPRATVAFEDLAFERRFTHELHLWTFVEACEPPGEEHPARHLQAVAPYEDVPRFSWDGLRWVDLNSDEELS